MGVGQKAATGGSALVVFVRRRFGRLVFKMILWERILVHRVLVRRIGRRRLVGDRRHGYLERLGGLGRGQMRHDALQDIVDLLVAHALAQLLDKLHK